MGTRSGAAAALGPRIRQRKLNTKSQLPILREDQIDDLEHDAHQNLSEVTSGVEREEEKEHHLQAALSASQAAAAGGSAASQVFIPTPDATQSSVQYDKVYPLKFSQPATYIRFSSTVEDCTGCPYDLDDEDDVFLTSINKTRNAATQCSEDQFEEVMNCFEETAHIKQPYAAVDSPPVLSWEDIEPVLEENLEENVRRFAKEVYQHWKARRLEIGNKALSTGLKFETGADTDDADPYVCFRRREVRQIRKTRGRDAHSAEKLKKLRKELEEARELLALIKQREITKKESLAVDRELFEQRTSLRNVKQNLPDQYKQGDEDLLITQKKKKPPEITQRPPGSQLRLPTRPDGRPAESDLYTLADTLAERERQVQEEIDQRIAAQAAWNAGFVDMTKAPLTPPLEVGVGSTFRTATTEYLPTPPASVSSEQSGEGVAADTEMANSNEGPAESKVGADPVAVRYASPSFDGLYRGQPSFRRRIGRGGRLWIDRRGPRSPRSPPAAVVVKREAAVQAIHDVALADAVSDRYRFDDEDEEEVPVYAFDPFDDESIRYRAKLFPPPQQHQHHHAAQQQAARRAQIEAAAAAAQGNRPSMSGVASGPNILNAVPTASIQRQSQQQAGG